MKRIRQSDTKFIFKNVSLLFRIGSAINAFPITWEIASPNILINSFRVLSRSKQILWYSLPIYVFLYTAFMYWGFYEYYPSYTEAEDVGPAVMHMVWVCGFSMCCVVLLHQLLNKDGMTHSVNQLIKFVTQSTRKYPEFANDYLKRWRLADKFFILLYPVIMIGALCYSALVLVYPDNKYYWYKFVLPKSFHSHWGIKLGSFCCELMLIYKLWIMYFLDNFLCIFYVDSLGTTLKILIMKKQSGEYSVQQMRDEFHEIHILNTLFHKSIATASGLPALKVSVTITALALVSVGIKRTTQLNPFVLGFFYLASITCLIVLGIVIPLSAKVHTKSTEFCFHNFRFNENENYEKRALSKKIVRNFRPFAISMSGLYYIHKGTILTYYNLFLVYLMSILMVINVHKVSA